MRLTTQHNAWVNLIVVVESGKVVIVVDQRKVQKGREKIAHEIECEGK